MTDPFKPVSPAPFHQPHFQLRPGHPLLGGQLVVDAYEIKSEDSHGVLCDASAGELRISGARIESLWENTGARAVMNQGGADDMIKLINCVLKVPLSPPVEATYSLDGTGTGVRVHCIPAFVANKARNATTTALLTNVISIVDATIS